MGQATVTTDRVERVLLALDEGAAERPSPLRDFARLLLARAPSDFLEEAPADEIAEEASRLFELLEATEADGITVRVRPLPGARRSVLETVMPDCSFIVNTEREFVHRLGLDILHLLHPVVVVRREPAGEVLAVESRASGGPTTSAVYMVVDGVLDEEMRASLQADLSDRLRSVTLVNEDFQAMLARSSEMITELERLKADASWRSAELEEIQDLLQWLNDGNFVFLGYRSYEMTTDESGERWVRVEPESGLGILREEADSAFRERRRVSDLPPDLRARVLGGPLLIISKTNSESPIHRLARMDYIGIKRVGGDGEVVGERRLLGLFTAKAYNQDVTQIPILRRKLREVLEAQGAAKGSHDYRTIFDVFGSMPLEELFPSSVSELSRLLAEIMETEGADEVRVTARPDALARGVHVMVILPKPRFSGDARRRIQEAVVAAYRGTLLNYHLALGEGDQARLHFYVAADPEDVSGVDLDALQGEVRSSVRTWEERLVDALRKAYALEEAHRLADRYRSHFSADYQAAVPAEEALEDIERLESLGATGRPQILFEELADPRPHALLLKVIAQRGQLVLSDAMPVLENFGFRVIQADKFEVGSRGEMACTIHVFEVEVPPEWDLDPGEARSRVEQAVWAIIDREAESDALNSLVLSAGLEWDAVALLRAYAGYAFRCGAVGSRTGVREPLARYPEIARLLVEIFHARLDPHRPADAAGSEELVQGFDRALAPVHSIEHDRTFRRLLALLEATVRTNYFQEGAGPRPTIALKFEPSRLDFLPRPLPRIEVYVNSPYTEGAHLRMDNVARGGIRWSDRHEDFRVEVLGLVKTQQVKNALIVPAGAKGAFLVKSPLPEGLSMREASVESYKEFIGALLDLSDDIRDREILHPERTVRLDSDDPYLVVAADKGTASLSDTANELAKERGFWLGDAFASGGSQGYDHKALGITAKGAWECVRRHFRELGTDIQNEPFSVAGIGDMSGDVFGNGMLLSRQIRLVAAFDHRHIFLDPSPEPKSSWEERKRLFDEPGSSWADYDAELLSAGGGVYERGAKRIDLSPEAREALGLSAARPEGAESSPLNGEDLVRAILTAPVDLLWNGGIGTYVKATGETQADVGDPGNDGVRVDAAHLRARVVGEGGNLGFTQRARVEYALHGGRINTDAIDNSGGVDLSDHEVNLKILLDLGMHRGMLEEADRNALLQALAEDVVESVLENNRSQSLAISLDERRAREAPSEFHDAQLELERAGLLDPSLEHLPDSDEYAERIEEGAFLTRPELAVLLACAKMHLKGEIQRSELANDPALRELVRDYFPRAAVTPGDTSTPKPGAATAGLGDMRVTDDSLVAEHPLHARLVATELTNRFVDNMGSTAHLRLARETGRPAWEIARAWFVASVIGETAVLRDRLRAIGGDVPTGVLYGWYFSLAEVLERTALWILASGNPARSCGESIEWLGPPVHELRAALAEVLPAEQLSDLQARRSLHEVDGLPRPLSLELSSLERLDELLPAARLVRLTGMEARTVGRVYFALGEEVGYPWLRRELSRLTDKSGWVLRAAKTLRFDLEKAVTDMVAEVLRSQQPESAETREHRGALVDRALAGFQARFSTDLAWMRRVRDEVQAMEHPTLQALVVAVDAVRRAADAGRA